MNSRALQYESRICSVRVWHLHMSNSVDPWRDYRRRRNLSLIALFGYVPVVGVFALALIRIFGTTAPIFAVALGWMVFVLVAGNRFLRFKCPRCGEPFFVGRWVYSTFVRHCLHCRLRKYERP